MTTLTRIPINPLRRGAQKLLANPQIMHAAVAAALPADGDGDGRILWRLDRRAHQVDLYVQAPEHPSLAHIIEQAGWSDSPSGQQRTADLQVLLDKLQAGQRWGFRTTLNPIRHVTRKGQRSAIVPHTTAAHQLQWFAQQADGRHGFTCTDHDAQLIGHDTLTFYKGSVQRPITLATATFQGILTVTDPDRLRHALVNGVGRARSYGCGLTTLAKT